LSARLKLNAAKVIGSLLISACIGGFAGSWWAFAISAALLIALSIYDGGIRLKPGKH
jgi:hypothetical protein